MSLIDIKIAYRSPALLSTAVLAACAAQEPLEFMPQPDIEEVAKLLNCPSDRMPTCVQRMGKPYSCYCMDEDALQQILEPDKY